MTFVFKDNFSKIFGRFLLKKEAPWLPPNTRICSFSNDLKTLFLKSDRTGWPWLNSFFIFNLKVEKTFFAKGRLNLLADPNIEFCSCMYIGLKRSIDDINPIIDI